MQVEKIREYMKEHIKHIIYI